MWWLIGWVAAAVTSEGNGVGFDASRRVDGGVGAVLAGEEMRLGVRP